MKTCCLQVNIRYLKRYSTSLTIRKHESKNHSELSPKQKQLPYNPPISLWGIYSKEMKSVAHRCLHIRVHYSLAKTRTQLKYLVISNWIKKMWCSWLCDPVVDHLPSEDEDLDSIPRITNNSNNNEMYRHTCLYRGILFSHKKEILPLVTT